MKKNNKKSCILNDDILKLAEAWAEEKKGNRSIIIIATDEGDGGLSNYVCGKSDHVVNAFCNTLMDENQDNQCARLMRRAVDISLLWRNIEKLEKSLEKSEKLSKAMLSDDTEETERETNNVKEDK